MQEQPTNKGTENQDLSTTQQTQNTEQTRNTQQTNLTQQFLALLNQGSADSSAGGFGETQARAEARAPISEAGAVGVRFSDGTPRSSQSQQTNTAETASREVNCLPCNGCCGRRRGRRLPGRVYDFVAWVAGVRGVPMCRVVNEYPELFCQGAGRGRGHGLGRVKELERLLSREAQYKGSYLVKRLGECSSDNVCVHYVRLGVEGWFRVVHLLANREPGDVDAYFAGLIRGLGFSGVAEASRYLRLVDQGLVDFNYVNRGRGYRDVLSVRCRICGGVIDVTGPLPSVLVRLIRHFRVEHGLAGPEDVDTKVKEIEGRDASRPEVDDTGIKLLRNSAELNQFVRLVVHRLMDMRLLERIGKSYRCRACNNDVGDTIDALVHVLRHHYDAINMLLGGRGMLSVDGFNDAVDELANLFNSGNPDGVKPTVKALVQGVVEFLNARGSASVHMLTRWLNEDDDYRLLLSSLTTGSVKADRVVAMIVEVMARHGLVHIEGEVVKAGD